MTDQEKIDILKQYYNSFKDKYMSEFCDLNYYQKKDIENTLGFAIFNLEFAVKEFKKGFKNSFIRKIIDKLAKLLG